MAEALLIVAVVIAAVAITVWLTRRAPRPERVVRGGAAPTVAPPKPPGRPGRGSGPGPGTRDPRRPRPQLGSGAAQLPLPLPKRRAARAVGRPLPPDR